MLYFETEYYIVPTGLELTDHIVFNSQSSCFILLDVGIARMYHYLWAKNYLSRFFFVNAIKGFLISYIETMRIALL